MPSDSVPSTADTSVARYCTLLQVTEAIASHQDLEGLFRDLALQLPHVLNFSYIALILHDPHQNLMRVQILEAPHPRYIKAGIELPVEASIGGWVWQHQQPIVCPDVEQEKRFPGLSN